MAGKELYRRFVNICQIWPRDSTKAGRDFGEHFRQILSSKFPHGDLGEVKDKSYVESAISALETIANNVHFNSNVLKRSSSTGLEAWACREAVSTECLRQLQEQEESTLIKRLQSTLSMSYKESENKVEKIEDK